MGLREYRRKRSFDRTPEPAGERVPKGPGAVAAPGNSFVIQKHAASRLHYDFRLEMEGVLRSWAVPKGPSLDPADKRLAAHVEDHPVEYGTFEGIIPKGQYGGGTVVVWDRGTWHSDGDPVRAYRAGKLKFRLDGDKLHGAWTLVRMGGPRNADGKNWLLIKEKDDAARKGRAAAIVDARPESVATGRTLDEVAVAKDRVWDSTRGGEAKTSRARPAARVRAAKPAPRRAARAPRTSVAIDLSRIDGAHEAPMPADVQPQLATLVTEAPTGAAWLHEIKFDGYRMLCRIEGGRATLTSRNAKDWTPRFAGLAAAAASLPVREALLDGEAVIVRDDGTTDFQALQNALSEGGADGVVYFAFDLLHLDGWDLRGAALRDRKRCLASILAGVGADGPIRYSDHVEGHGAEFVHHACRMALEGAISKRADRPYVGGRGRDWVKVKCVRGQEVVIVGFTAPSGARSGFGALLVGVHDPKGRLRFAGKVGTGFSERSLADLHRKLTKIEQETPPVVDPPTGADAQGVRWVRPTLVAEVSFTEWTREGRLRHPSFKGLRTDKAPRAIVREREKDVAPDGAADAADAADDDAADTVAAAPAAARPRRVRRSAAVATRAVRRASPSEVAGVAITNPARVLYPGQELTKLDLARYYDAVAKWMLPHVADRPLTLVRCPQGEGSKCFFQKHATEQVPGAVQPIAITDGAGPATYMTVDSAEGLVSLVQIGVLEIHVWGSRAADLEHPDRIIFDLDPDPSLGWDDVVDGALEVRERLADLSLQSFVKTTGGKGLHVVVPLRGRSSWDNAKAFSRALADAMTADSPARYTATMSKAKRHGRIFIDWLRNGRGATAIAPYSSRARPGAPVATPIHWSELGSKVRPGAFDVGNVPPRLARLRSDPWRDLASVRQSITAAARRKLGVAGG